MISDNKALDKHLSRKRVSNLIGKGLSCHESRCRIEAGLTRYLTVTLIIDNKGKVATGKARHLLCVAFQCLGVRFTSFPRKISLTKYKPLIYYKIF